MGVGREAIIDWKMFETIKATIPVVSLNEFHIRNISMDTSKIGCPSLASQVGTSNTGRKITFFFKFLYL